MSAVDDLFLDTNILVYAYDRGEPVKGPTALNLLTQLFAQGWPLLSTQVLAEFYWTVTRKLSVPLSHPEAVAEISRFQVFARIVPMTMPIFEKALVFVGTHNLPLWDAQILAATKLNGATRVLSEDFQHRHVLEGITFLNPFAPDFSHGEILIP
jgi:predicted nucleic acid-binding protein